MVDAAKDPPSAGGTIVTVGETKTKYFRCGLQVPLISGCSFDEKWLLVP